MTGPTLRVCNSPRSAVLRSSWFDCCAPSCPSWLSGVDASCVGPFSCGAGVCSVCGPVAAAVGPVSVSATVNAAVRCSDRLLDEHGQARAQRARQSEDRHERVERRNARARRVGRSSSGLSVGRTPASSATSVSASCVFRCGIGRAGSCDADGSSDCASMAVRLLGRGVLGMPNPRSRLWRPACQCCRPPCGWHGWGECREICPWSNIGGCMGILSSRNGLYRRTRVIHIPGVSPWCGRTRVLLCGPSRQEDHSAGTMETHLSEP